MKKHLFLTLLIAVSIASCKKGTTLPFTEDFESPHYPPNGWVQFPIDSANYWLREEGVSAYGKGKACISYNNLAPTSVLNTYRGIRLPFMDFSNVKDPYLRFDIAYAERQTIPPDSLTMVVLLTDTFGIWWSVGDDSTHWNNVKNYGGSDLASAPPTTGEFVPDSSQWRTFTLPVKAVAGLESFRLGIENDCYKANKIYFDNVYLFDSVAAGK